MFQTSIFEHRTIYESVHVAPWTPGKIVGKSEGAMDHSLRTTGSCEQNALFVIYAFDFYALRNPLLTHLTSANYRCTIDTNSGIPA